MESNEPTDLIFDPDIYESQFAYVANFTDIPFWIQLGKSFGPKILDLACGGGRVTIPAFESGLDIDGIDFSQPLLALAQDRAKARSLPINFILGDIRALPFQHQYDLMFLPTATISHLVTRSEVESFFAGVRAGLRANGVLALDVHNPTKTWLKCWPLKPEPELSSFVHRRTKQNVHVQTRYAYQADKQVFTVSYHYTFHDNSSKDCTVVLRLYFPEELQTLLHYNGFDILDVYGDYSQRHFDSESAKYVIVARKRAGT